MTDVKVVREIDPAARVSPEAEIGPYCVIGPHVTIGPGSVLIRRISVAGHTTIGSGNFFDEGCVIGARPQDLKYKGHPTLLLIGHRNRFGRSVTAHIGTEPGGFVTRIGDANVFSDGVHIAHDDWVGNDCILSNCVQLAGHVRLEDKVTIAGLVGVHHFTTLGTLAYIGGLTRIVADVPPFMIVEGNPSRVRAFNETGMRRWGFDDGQVRGVREAYRLLFGSRAEGSGTPLSELPTYTSREPANEVLEVAAGRTRELGVRVGDRVAFEF